jgi:TetR/AcrR family transcriptional regulator, tetracycline repressor protein
MALDRALVVKTAIDLMDDVGLDGLSLRRLAKELNVQAPALYWHFKNKQELLDQMAEAIARTEMPQRPLAEVETWDEWLTTRARDMRASLNRHRDGAMLAASTHPQPSQWSDIEEQLEIMMNAGMSAPDAMYTMIAVGNYVSGFTLDEQADRLRNEERDEADFEEFLGRLAAFPRFVAALRVVGDPQSDAAFEAGLALIIGGAKRAIPS